MSKRIFTIRIPNDFISLMKFLRWNSVPNNLNNMDKLTRYNQVLLAIMGTAIIITAGVLLIVGLGGLIVTLINSGSEKDTGIQIRNDQNTQTDSIAIRTQAITFNNEYQLDTAKAIYLIPVGQVNLEKEERMKLEGGSGFEYASSDYGYEYHYGLYNNFVLYNFETGQKIRLFNEKVAVTDWTYLKIDNTELLLFKGTKTDFNNDKLLDENDYQCLFAYYLNNEELIEYNFDNKTVLEFEAMRKTELVSIKIGIDKNGDFEFDRNMEPQEIIALNVKTKKVQELISAEMKEEIQITIDN